MLSQMFDRSHQPPISRLDQLSKSSFLTSLPVDPRPQLLTLARSAECQKSISQALGADFHLRFASTSEQGLMEISQECPDVILCDLDNRPKDLIDYLKKSGFGSTPILIMANEKDRQKALAWIDHGATDILSSLQPAEVKARLSIYLHSAKAQRILQNEMKRPSINLCEMAGEITLKNRELFRTNRLKDEFMAMLSHELRNPINVISGFAEVLLSNTEDTELIQEAAQAIYRNAQFQVKLVQDLMDVSRSIAGKMILDCKPQELVQILKEVLPSAQTAAHSKGIKLFVHLKSSGLIQGDATRLSQVIWNLLSNAIKFTPEGGQVDIELQNQGNWIEFAVRDTGVGIEADFLPFIFEQFHQQDTTITKNYGGLGLGLAIVKHIVELHRGSIAAHSEGAGQGATFTVRFPSILN